MALARTTRVGAASATGFGTGAYTPTGATFTPANNSVLVAAAFVGFSSINGTWAPTISDTASGVWTQRASVSSTAGGWASGIRVWTCDVVTGTSRTVSFDQGTVSVDGGYAVSILEYTGQHATSQAGATAKIAAGVDGADSVTVTATPVAADVELGFLGRDMNSGTATSTQGATFTELQDFTTSVGVGMESEERTGSTSTTVDWADLNTAAGDLFRIALAGIIVKAADSGITGTAAITLNTFAAAGVGSVGSDSTGTAAVTLGAFTVAASGTVTNPAITGTAAITLATFTTAGSGVTVNGDYPVAVSGDSRYLVDQHGDPWFGVADTAWSLVGQLTTAEITTYMEDRAGRGVNFVLFEAPGSHLFGVNAPNNLANEPPFTGAAFQTALNEAAWLIVDHAVKEAARLGITCMICPAYLGFAGTEEGWNTEVVAATNGQMTTYGQTLAARYGAYPNVVWLIGHDRDPDATEAAREAALADALKAGTTHLLTVGGVEQDGSAAWSGTGVDYDFDTVYSRNTEAPAQQTQDCWANTPTLPTGYFEGLYEGDGAGPTRGRNQMWSPLCSGATYVFFGNSPIWHFESSAWPGWSGTWETALNLEGSQDLARLATFMATLNGAWAAMVPDLTDTFLTVGEGTGATRASARFDAAATTGTLAVAYRPHGGAATLTFDLAEFTAVTTVKIRKFDPTNGTYTTVGTFATSGTQNVGSFGTNSGGDGDWVLVFEQSDDRTGTAAITLNTFTVSATGTVTPPSITGTAAITLAAFTSSALGSFTPTGSGSGAITLDPFTAIGTGTVTPPTITGTAAITLGLFICLASSAPIGGVGTATVGVAGSGSTAITPGASASATVSQGTGTGATT